MAVDAQTVLHCTPDTRHGFFLTCRRRMAIPLHRQTAGDLGRKMSSALLHALRTHRAAIVIGTDCAVLTPAEIEAAFAALEAGHVTVIKPAADGGYVLIGATRFTASALRHIDWSSGRELRQTLHRLQRLNLPARLLPSAWDVDRPSDLVKATRRGDLPRLPAGPLHSAKKAC